jgi:hypothetical protein
MTVAGIFISIITGLVVNEFCEISPWAALKLVKWSARRRYADPARADARAEELAALIEDRPGKLFKLVTACGFAVAAVGVLSRRTVRRHKQSEHAFKERFGTLRPHHAAALITAFGLLGCVVTGTTAAALTPLIAPNLTSVAVGELVLAFACAVLVAASGRLRNNAEETLKEGSGLDAAVRIMFFERSSTIPRAAAAALITVIGLLGCVTTGTAGAVLTLCIAPHLTAAAFAELVLAFACAVLVAASGRLKSNAEETLKEGSGTDAAVRITFFERSSTIPHAAAAALITVFGLLGCVTTGTASAVLTLRIAPSLAAVAFAELALAFTCAVLAAASGRLRSNAEGTPKEGSGAVPATAAVCINVFERAAATATVPRAAVAAFITVFGLLGCVTTGTAGVVLTLRIAPNVSALAFAELAMAFAAGALIAVSGARREFSATKYAERSP